MKLARYGMREWLGSGCIALLLGGLWLFVALRLHQATGIALMVLTGLLWLAIAAFFRVPRRTIAPGDEVLVSPADGLVRDIGPVRDHGIDLFEGQELLRIGIFLSVLDVHVNRAPCAFSVEYRKYKEGRFLDARNPLCAKENESLVIAGTGQASTRSFPVAVRQISGAIARRIVCDSKPGARLDKGEIYGMIKFGSRTELYLPNEPWVKVAVKVGDKVRSGSSVIARMGM
ncbi:MAG: phosphatidylserine decarboxylase [Kiritimatiellales bacterium]|nr:phosphatidylserine decarboxylase [Kiritimatiellales bacterium]MCF7863837.1 phosphatidylserine decarboxylase [Kiritimatiellales bacterium]